MRSSINGFFLTLKYNNENLSLLNLETQYPTLDKRDLQLFTKRLRKDNKLLWDNPLRYYHVGEYGGRTGRPHYHSVSYNIHPDLLNRLESIWGMGHVHIGTITPASIHYVAKFHVNAKKDDDYDRLAPFAMMSKSIGLSYLNRATNWHRDNENQYLINNGFKQRIPRYYKEKLFDPVTRKRMSKQNIITSDLAYWREYERLSRLGIQEPDHYMQVSEIKSAQAVTHKSKNQDYH